MPRNLMITTGGSMDLAKEIIISHIVSVRVRTYVVRPLQKQNRVKTPVKSLPGYRNDPLGRPTIVENVVPVRSVTNSNYRNTKQSSGENSDRY